MSLHTHQSRATKPSLRNCVWHHNRIAIVTLSVDAAYDFLDDRFFGIDGALELDAPGSAFIGSIKHICVDNQLDAIVRACAAHKLFIGQKSIWRHQKSRNSVRCDKDASQTARKFVIERAAAMGVESAASAVVNSLSDGRFADLYELLFRKDDIDYWKNSLTSLHRAKKPAVPSERNIASMAFAVPYTASEDLVGRFSNFVSAQIDAYVDEAYYAPYFAVVQSSGTGKSRLLEMYGLSKHSVFLYCSLARVESNAYPERSFISDVLCAHQSERFFVAFFRALFETVAKPKSLPPIDAMFFTPCRDFWSKIILKASNYVATAGIEGDSDQAAMKAFSEMAVANKRPFVFCLDEARSLLNPSLSSSDPERHDVMTNFRMIRRVLHRIVARQTRRFMLIVTDATSHIQFQCTDPNIAPPSREDPSNKNDATPLQLLPPFYLMTNYNVGDDPNLPDPLLLLRQKDNDKSAAFGMQISYLFLT